MSDDSAADPTAATPIGDAAPAFRRRGFLRLSWPLLVVTLLTLVATIGDTVILSLASPELNAAVATANQILGIPYDLSVLFSIGALVVISQLLGAHRETDARRATVIALRANTLFGLAIAVVVAIAGPFVVPALNTPPELVDDTLAYLFTVAGALVLNAFIVVATAVLRAYGRTVSILVLGVLVNVAYLALQFVFVIVLDLGAFGAALSTLLVRGVGVLVIGVVVYRRTGVHPFTRIPPRDALDAGAGRMARLSIPTVLENGLFNVAILFVVGIVNTLGTDAINARSYALTLTALVTGLVLALAQGNETIVGWDTGERDAAHAKRQTLRTAAWAAGLALVLSTALWLGGDAILPIFGPSPEVTASASSLLLLSIAWLPLAAVSTVLFAALRSTGDVLVPMLYSLGTSFALLLPLAYVFIEVAGLGLGGLWASLIVAETVKAALLLGRWLRGVWARIPSVALEGAATTSVEG